MTRFLPHYDSPAPVAIYPEVTRRRGNRTGTLDVPPLNSVRSQREEPTVKRPIHRLQLIALLMLAACAHVDESVDTEPVSALMGVEWIVTTIAAEPADTAGVELTAVFESGQIAGYSGCNRFSGSSESAADGQIRIGPLAGTRMACDTAIMALEGRYLQALESTTGYALSSSELTLSGQAPDGSATRIVLVRRDAPNDVSSSILGPLPFRGYVTIGHEVRSFTPCDAEAMYWIVDQSSGELRAIYDSLTSQPYQPVFAILEGAFRRGPADGFGADYGGQLTVSKIWRAEREGRGCDEDLSRFEFRARGNEPFWSLSISHHSIQLTELGVAAPNSWIVDHAAENGGVWSYAALSTAQLAAIEVMFTETPCRDSMSGAYFSFAVDVEIGSRHLNGCAARGY